MPITDTVGSYITKNDVGYAGMPADTSLKDISSRVIEGAPVAFGLAVGAGAGDGSAMLGGTGFEGISVADKAQEQDVYPVGAVAGVKRKGSIWITASTNVTPADPVTFTAATGVMGAGLATTIADAKFETTATAGNLVRVHIG